MKKSLLALLLAVALVVPAFAAKTSTSTSKSKNQQTKQTTIFVGGEIYYESNDYDEGGKITEFNFAPYIGFNINDKWDLGCQLVFINRKDDTRVPEQKVNGWDISPFARYNVIKYGKFTFYIKGELMFGKYDLTQGAIDTSVTEIGISAAPQIQFNFTKNLSLVGTLGFARIGYEKEDGDNYKHSNFYFGEGNGSLYTVGIEYKF